MDALFLVTNAPGRSAYNPVERRMAPLSSQLSGVILKPDHYGSHLNNRGKTIDETLERKNFSKAGNTLAELWNEVTIDNHPVKAEFIEPTDKQNFVPDFDILWYSKHVQESQYFLQVKFESINLIMIYNCIKIRIEIIRRNCILLMKIER